MAGFVYFIPQVAPQAARDLVAERLGQHPARREVGAGPGGGRGALFAQTAEDAVFEPGQVWREAGSAVRFARVGAPGPEDLVRARTLGSYAPILGDGAPWLVPTAITWDEQGRPVSPLPKVRT